MWRGEVDEEAPLWRSRGDPFVGEELGASNTVSSSPEAFTRRVGRQMDADAHTAPPVVSRENACSPVLKKM